MKAVVVLFLMASMFSFICFAQLSEKKAKLEKVSQYIKVLDKKIYSATEAGDLVAKIE